MSNSFSMNFSEVHSYGKNKPIDLMSFLYVGGASTSARYVHEAIATGKLGVIQFDRAHLLRKVYEYLKARLMRGHKFVSVCSVLIDLRWFYRYVDSLGLSPTVDTVFDIYVDWSVLIYKRQLENLMSVSEGYKQVYNVGSIFEGALNFAKGSFTQKIVVLKGGKRKPTLSIAQDKQVLSDSVSFDHEMAQITRCLSFEVFNCNPPFEIKFSDGSKFIYLNRKSKLIEVSGLTIAPGSISMSGTECAWSKGQRDAYLNLRIEAELEIFISQTGANSGQVVELTRNGIQIGRFLDVWTLKAYKPRRMGEVTYEVFSEYQKHLQKYLDFYDKCFPNSKDSPLFPMVTREGLFFREKYTGYKVRNFLSLFGKKYVAPSYRRNTRENWIARRSEDPLLAAGMANHSFETHVKSYSRPNLILASKELSDFFSTQNELLDSLVDGRCNGLSSLSTSTKELTISPDCRNVAGCLFCSAYKAINSFDYIWSMVSYRKLKTLELASERIGHDPTVEVVQSTVLNRIKQILRQFISQGDENKSWYKEAVLRVEEGSYHQRWSIIIQIMESI